MDVRLSVLWIAVAGLVAAAAAFVSGYWAGMANAGGSVEQSSTSVPYPDWFLPIWDAYGRNPEITPQFDFAALYSGRMNTR